MKNFCVGVLLLVFSNATLFAQELKLGSPFQEHMVLQRDMPLAIWGEAAPDSLVSVKLGKDTINTNANAEGTWKAILPSRKAGGPYNFIVSSGTESIKFVDVMVGEVWICAGQSNMAMHYKNIPDIQELETSAKNIRTFNIQRTVAFTEQKNLAGEWKIGNPPSAVAFSFAYFLQQAADVPVGIILTAWGSSSIEGWMPRSMTGQLPHFKTMMANFDSDTLKQKRIRDILEKGADRTTKEDIFLRTQPNIIYNAMLKPLAPISCRGLIWYQGEANSKSIENMLQYGETLPLWVEHLRKLWDNEQLHFFGVTLPGFVGKKDAKNNPSPENPEDFSWAWMRESQYKILSLSNTQMANTIDLGEKYDIHPKDKLPIGKRLALLAKKSTLDRDVVAHGPSLKNIEILDNSIILSFDNAVGLKTIDGREPAAFWLANESRKWFPAKAKIQGQTIVLASSKIELPLYVRYAFSAKPRVNLINSDGLPAIPFRTDRFSPKVSN